MPWLELKIPCEAQQAESLGDLLFELSALSVTFEDAQDNPIFEPKPGTMPLWQQTNVIALFAEDADLVPVYAQLQQDYPKAFAQHHLHRVEDQAWEKAYLESFQPLQITDNLWICPSWHKPPDPTAINVLLDPGVAFGTGSHETTQLCLQALAETQLQDKIVIDFGCGSGILAIAALKLGAKDVVAIDIHEQALEATQYNAEMNQLKNKIKTYHPKHQPAMKADIIVANILAEPLISLSTQLYDLLENTGHLILSGLLVEQIEQVTKAYPDLMLHKTTILNEWACLHFIK